MTINRIAFCLIILLSLFAIYCSIVIGMSWDEPQNHWQGAIRADYLKSFEFGKFKFKPGGWSEVEPGLYDTFHFFIADFLLKNDIGRNCKCSKILLLISIIIL